MDSRLLVVADLDGTLLGDDEALARFAAWHAEARADHWLAYATGRSRDSVARLVIDTPLPEPDVAITMVGTEIHDRAGRAWPGWDDRLRGWDAAGVRAALSLDDRLELQPLATQTALKSSYFASRLPPAKVEAIGRLLAAAGFPVTVVYSGDRFLDILPAGAGKGAAAAAVAHELGVPADRVLVFGDSGNDASLFRAGFHGTLVANALPELRAAVESDVYRSPLRYADGVLDGIRYWAPRTGSAAPVGITASGNTGRRFRA